MASPIITDKHIQQLIDSLISQATYFLNEAGEFYPFGAILDADMRLRPIGFFTKDEYPSSQEVLNELETAVKAGFENQQYRVAAIGVDVTIKDTTGDAGQISAMQIRIYTEDGIAAIRYAAYEKTGDGFEFGELFERS